MTTGLIPSAVWRTSFGKDREGLIGHKIDADKLEKKVPQNLSGLDLQLSILEPLFDGATEAKPWIFDTATPSHADIALYYQLDWGEKISRGEGIANLTGGESGEQGEGSHAVFNQERYPGVCHWFERMKRYVDSLPLVETRVELGRDETVGAILHQLRDLRLGAVPLLITPGVPMKELDDRNGLTIGAHISVTPDDTGRDDPSVGTLLALSPEEVVIAPDKIDGRNPRVGELRVHFPRVGFVARPAQIDAAL